MRESGVSVGATAAGTDGWLAGAPGGGANSKNYVSNIHVRLLGDFRVSGGVSERACDLQVLLRRFQDFTVMNG